MVTISNVVALVGQPLSEAEILIFEILLLDCVAVKQRVAVAGEIKLFCVKEAPGK